jgi:CRISPR/Cas system-associated exonuclease Cas4 (RecB family)
VKKDVLPLPDRRGQPFVWITWLTRLLSGEDKCEWPLLMRSRFWMPKEPVTDRMREYQDAHRQLVKMRVAELEHQGLYVNVEDDNKLAHKGKSGTMLTGIPDIAVIQPSTMTYEECKSGKRRPSDHVQVLLYAQLAKQNRVDKEITGNIVYLDGIESVEMTRLSEITHGFVDLMSRINSENVPRRPSPMECRFCKVRSFCDERADQETDAAESLQVTAPF